MISKQAGSPPQPIGQVVFTVFDDGNVNVQTNLDEIGVLKSVGLGMSAIADIFHKRKETSVQPVKVSQVPGRIIVAN